MFETTCQRLLHPSVVFCRFVAVLGSGGVFVREYTVYFEYNTNNLVGRALYFLLLLLLLLLLLFMCCMYKGMTIIHTKTRTSVRSGFRSSTNQV